jgi:hypothetical protein
MEELLETNNETTLAAKQQILTSNNLTTTVRNCFLSGPCQDVITETNLEVSCKSVCEEKTRRLISDGRQPGS